MVESITINYKCPACWAKNKYLPFIVHLKDMEFGKELKSNIVCPECGMKFTLKHNTYLDTRWSVQYNSKDLQKVVDKNA